MVRIMRVLLLHRSLESMHSRKAWFKLAICLSTCLLYALTGCGARGDEPPASSASNTGTSGAAEPVDLAWSSLAVGYYQNCAIRPDATTWCWEPNANGGGEEVGTVVGPFIPELVAEDHEFTTVTVGDGHGCGLNATGAAWCWGENGYGQLGDGTVDDGLHPIPKAVLPGTAFTSIAASDTGACAVTSTADLYCWGDDYNGDSGTSYPQEYGVEYDWASVSKQGPGLCGHTASKEWLCLSSSSGALAEGFSMVATEELGFTQMAGSREDACGLDVDAAWVCSTPFVAGPDLDLSTAPTTWTDVAAGDSHWCALADDGTAWCVGSNSEGQLGNGTLEDSTSAPVQVTDGPERWVDLAAEGDMTCGAGEDGSLWCWGASSRSHDESEARIDATVPNQVPTTDANEK